MANYSDLRKLARVQLPNGAKPYALIDKDLRLIIATDFNELSGVYHEGDHVFYQDDLYRFKADHATGAWNSAQVDQVTVDSEIRRLEGLITPFFSTTATYTAGDHVIYQGQLYRFKKGKAAGTWDSTKVDPVTIDSEIQRIEGIIAGGIHYRGKTTSELFDGASTDHTSPNYVQVLVDGKEIKEQGDMVIVDRSAAAVEYTEHTAYTVHTYIKHGNRYYITNSTVTAQDNTDWDAIEDKMDELKTDPEFLCDGTYWNILGPVADGLGNLAFQDTASGNYDKTTKAEVVIYTYDIATSKLVTQQLYAVSNIDAIVSKIIAKQGQQQWDNKTLNVGDAKVKNSKTTLVNGLTGTKVFNTDAVKNVHASGTTTFNTEGYVAQVGSDTAGWEDCLIFATGVTSSFTIEADPAGTATFELATAEYYEVEPTDIEIQIATASAASRITTPVTYATGGVAENGSGSSVAIDVEQGTEVATATLGYTPTQIVVK